MVAEALEIPTEYHRCKARTFWFVYLQNDGCYEQVGEQDDWMGAPWRGDKPPVNSDLDAEAHGSHCYWTKLES